MAECEIPVSLSIADGGVVEAPEAEITVVAEPLRSQDVECVMSVPSRVEEESSVMDTPPFSLEAALSGAPTPVPEETPSSEDVPTAHCVPTRAATGTSRPPRRSFTTKFKLEVIEHAERTRNKTETARVFDVNRRRVQEWCMQKEKLMSVPKDQKRITGAGPRPSKPPQNIEIAKVAGGDALFNVPSLITPTSDTSNNGDSSQSSADKLDLSEVDRSKLLAELSQWACMLGSEITPETIINSILRGLTSSETPSLSPGLVKMIQDLISDMVSQDAKGTATARDVAMEMLVPKAKGEESSNSVPGTVQSSTESTQDFNEPTNGVLTSPEATSESMDTVGATVDSQDVQKGTIPDLAIPSIQEQAMEGMLATLGNPDATAADLSDGAGAQLLVDPTAQAAILDALIQVASSVQMLTADMSQLVNLPTVSAIPGLPAVSTLPAISATSGLPVVPSVTSGLPVIPSVTSAVTTAVPSDLPTTSSVPSVTSDLSAVPTTSNMPTVPTSDLPNGSEPQSVVPTHLDDIIPQVNTTGVNSEPSTEEATEVTMEEKPASLEPEVGNVKPAYNRGKTKKVYSLDFKLDCIKCAETTSKCAAAKKFAVDRRRVQDWCSQKIKLQQLKGTMSEDTRPVEIEVEKQLAEWVQQEQEAGHSLTRRMMGEQAALLYQENGISSFAPSIGWVAKFMIRNGISLMSRRLSQPPTPRLTSPTD